MVRKKTEMRPFGLPLLLSLILSPTLVGASDPIPLEPGRKSVVPGRFRPRKSRESERRTAGSGNILPALSSPETRSFFLGGSVKNWTVAVSLNTASAA